MDTNIALGIGVLVSALALTVATVPEWSYHRGFWREPSTVVSLFLGLVAILLVILG